VVNCSIEDLTAKLRLALQDRDERIRRGLYAKEYALNNYSWSSIALQTIEVYRSLKSRCDRQKY
jgi:glycosyltransferase involved in cell wall biosynthesis